MSLELSKLQKTTIKSSLKQRAAMVRKIQALEDKKNELCAIYDAEISTHVSIKDSIEDTIKKTAGENLTIEEIESLIQTRDIAVLKEVMDNEPELPLDEVSLDGRRANEQEEAPIIFVGESENTEQIIVNEMEENQEIPAQTPADTQVEEF